MKTVLFLATMFAFGCGRHDSAWLRYEPTPATPIEPDASIPVDMTAHDASTPADQSVYDAGHDAQCGGDDDDDGHHHAH